MKKLKSTTKQKLIKALVLFIDIAAMGALIFLDQYTKNEAVLRLKNKPAFSIINGIL